MIVNLAARVWIDFCDKCLDSPLLCEQLLIMAILLLGLLLMLVYKSAGVNSPQF